MFQLCAFALTAMVSVLVLVYDVPPKVAFAVYVLTPVAAQVAALVTAFVIVALTVCLLLHLVQVKVAVAEV